ncbi:MAG: hypothetical protein GY811_03750 [Myxococcales bacterium]|nr:hypothetical protein [Myxococcales bacterium]
MILSASVAPTVEIHIAHAALADLAVDAIVLPCHSIGSLTDAARAALAGRGAEGFEAAIKAKAPLAIGAAILADASEVEAGSAILVPISENADAAIATELLRRGVKAALIAARLKGYRTLALPSMIACDGSITVAEAARAVTQEMHAHATPVPETIYIAAPDKQLQRIFESAVTHAERAGCSL